MCAIFLFIFTLEINGRYNLQRSDSFFKKVNCHILKFVDIFAKKVLVWGVKCMFSATLTDVAVDQPFG
jgi:hypothetical protein